MKKLKYAISAFLVLVLAVSMIGTGKSSKKQS